MPMLAVAIIKTILVSLVFLVGTHMKVPADTLKRFPYVFYGIWIVGSIAAFVIFLRTG